MARAPHFMDSRKNSRQTARLRHPTTLVNTLFRRRSTASGSSAAVPRPVVRRPVGIGLEARLPCARDHIIQDVSQPRCDHPDRRTAHLAPCRLRLHLIATHALLPTLHIATTPITLRDRAEHDTSKHHCTKHWQRISLEYHSRIHGSFNLVLEAFEVHGELLPLFGNDLFEPFGLRAHRVETALGRLEMGASLGASRVAPSLRNTNAHANDTPAVLNAAAQPSIRAASPE